MEFKVGTPTRLTDEVLERIIKFTPQGLRPWTISALADVPETNLRRWLKRGKEEHANEIDSIYSQLWRKYAQSLGGKISYWITNVETKKNWQGSWKLLETVAKEDFGMSAEQFEQIVKEFAELKQIVSNLKDSKLKELQHGREMDTESDQAPRGSA